MTTSVFGNVAETLADLVAASRALGCDPRLVLHGGGNSSLKTVATDVDGRPVDVLWVKGSGHDMATIGPDGFAPLRLELLRRLLPPVQVPDSRLRSELRCALLDADAPDPSVETLVHACLPAPAVLHSHSDALLTVGSALERDQLTQLLAPDVIVVDYAMPGPDLVAAIAAAWQDAPPTAVGVFVVGHGLFTVGATPAEALQRHLAVVARADAALSSSPPADVALPEPDMVALADLRRQLCELAGRPLVMRRRAGARVAAFVSDPALMAATAAGPLTPDHVTYTKPWPLLGRDVAAFAARYDAYIDAHQGNRGGILTRLDAAPRIVLDPDLGLVSIGRTAREAAVAGELYEHTMDAIAAAERLGRYRGTPDEHTFDLEYWHFQQQKLRRRAEAGDLTGQVAVVTGAASGIGRGCVAALLDAGACVVGWDLSEHVRDTFDTDRFLGVPVDVTDSDAVRHGLQAAVETYGGVDILVVAAGIFPTSANLGEMELSAWRKTMAVNVDSVVDLYGQAHPLLAAAQPYGRVVLIASKNALAPGTGAAAYSSSKAAVTQLSRVAALEWAGEGIRVNMIHPDAVFDTGLWTPELLAARAEHYGLSVDAYKRRNLLHAEVTSAKVGALCRAMCSPAFECTTGAQVPIDGGSDRVI